MKILIKRLVTLAIVFLIMVVSAPTGLAQSSERILSFDTAVIVDAGGRATISETIIYDFGSNQRQGIFRDIPKQYFVEGDTGYELSVELISVEKSAAGQGPSAEPYTIIDIGDEVERIRIGREGQFISGVHEYEINYTLEPIAVLDDNGMALIRIDAPGTGWQVPVESVKITLNAPAQPLQRTCYLGAAGSTDQNCNPARSGFRATGLLPGETITAEYEFEPDTFASYAELKTIDRSSGSWWPAVLFLGLGSAITGLFAIRPIVGYLRYYKRRKEETVYARYEPPKDMKPADIGLLFDNSSSGAELSATIIDLAVRGYLKIIQDSEKRWWRRAKYSLKKQKPGDGLKGFESDLFKAFFKEGDTAELDKLKVSSDFQTANINFHKKLKKRLEKMGFYKKANLFAFDLASRMTDAGYTRWAAVEGFRDFLSVTEKDRLAFHDAPEKKPEQFSEYLPYAVALGVERQWAEQFKDLSVDTTWYQGQSGQHLALANISSVTSGLNAIAASANRSSGSSGFGGGSSGGGFSGGGGGSW